MAELRSALYTKSIVVLAILLGGCNVLPSEKPGKINVFYWTHTGAERCVDLSGVPYCFLKNDIAAANFITDPEAGFLFAAPIDDPSLVDCEREGNLIDWESHPYPNIQMTVGEVRGEGDTIDKKFRRVLNLELGVPIPENGYSKGYNIIEPKQYIEYYGENCLKLNDRDLGGREALCYGGNFEKGEVGYFWGCNADGSVPFPSCNNQFYYRRLEYSVTAGKACAPYMNNKLRDFAINFVDEGRKRAQALSTKPRQPIK
jgi:hypothetical protein